MKKKITFLKILIAVIVISIIATIIIVFINKDNDNNENNNNNNYEKIQNIDDSNDEVNNYVTKHLTYRNSELYDENGNKVDFVNYFDTLYLSFHENDVDVCIDKCNNVNYSMTDSKLTIDEGSKFSGEYEIENTENKIILKQKSDNNTTIYYYFDEPKG